jgi:peptidoglycan hydrolase CwlO-like protein
MSLFAKIMVIVNFILAVAFLAAAGTLLGASEDYKAKYEKALADAKDESTKLNAQVTERENKIKETGIRIADTDKARAAAEALLKELQNSNTALSTAGAQLRADLDKLADAQKDLQNTLASQNKMIDEGRDALSKSEAARKEGDAKIKAQSDEIARLAQANETAEKTAAASAADAKVLREKVDEQTTLLDRYKKEKGPITGGVTMKPVNGVVQACNNKVDIYIISVGSHDGVEVGYEFTVYRGSEYVSTIVIDKVFPNYASGTTKTGTKKRDVMAGDECTTRL